MHHIRTTRSGTETSYRSSLGSQRSTTLIPKESKFSEKANCQFNGTDHTTVNVVRGDQLCDTKLVGEFHETRPTVSVPADLPSNINTTPLSPTAAKHGRRSRAFEGHNTRARNAGPGKGLPLAFLNSTEQSP
jgi:hypothetical protein